MSNKIIFITLFIFVPVVGPLAWFICKFVKNNSSEDIALELEELKSDKNKDIVNSISKIELIQEIDKLSMNDALILNDAATRRKMVMDIVGQEDIIDYIEVLRNALGNKDIETVHYASAIIMQAQKQVMQNVAEYKKRYELSPESSEALDEYEMMLYKTIFSNLYDNTTVNRYIEDYTSLSNKILGKAKADEKYFARRINIEIKKGNTKELLATCRMYQNSYTHSEGMILSCMKSAVALKDRNLLNNTIKLVVKNNIQLSDETKEYIDYFITA